MTNALLVKKVLSTKLTVDQKKAFLISYFEWMGDAVDSDSLPLSTAFLWMALGGLVTEILTLVSWALGG